MTVFAIRAKKVVEFVEAAGPAGLLAKMHPDKHAIVTGFVKDYLASDAPAVALRDYHLKLAPLEMVFDRSRDLARVAIGLLEAWTLSAGNAAMVLAETGAWLLGADEAEDLEKLEKLTAAFVKFFGAAGLPPALKGDELKKQIAAHLKARAEKPRMPPGQQRSTLQASQRDLNADCELAFRTFHDFLDGYYGKTGDAAFTEKSKFAYDRRAGRRSAKDATPPTKAALDKAAAEKAAADKTAVEKTAEEKAHDKSAGEPAAKDAPHTANGASPAATA
jgi:hypothetical protein